MIPSPKLFQGQLYIFEMGTEGELDPAVYAIEAQVEADHWWFVGRRRLFGELIRSLNFSPADPVLDIGTGTGSNLRLLRQLSYSNVRGVDSNPAAIFFCQSKNLGEVLQGDICDLPFSDGQFRLVLATDVIEHVEDDARAFSEIARVMGPGGIVIISVPAFPCLWGRQDEVAHHRRRYKRKEMERAIRKAGLIPKEIFYFNYLLFFPIWLARQIICLFDLPLASENQVNTPWLNRMLNRIFAWDTWSARRLKPSFGASLSVIAKKVNRI